MDNPWCVQKPEKNRRQRDFLKVFDLEALYGGAAGGGKSSALLMAAAQFLDVPGYNALLLRRTFADLGKPGALMDRSHAWWGGKAKWRPQEHSWTFPSGARVVFGYLENESDKFNYQSSEWQFVGFDELTQFRESQYTYLFSRLRRLKGVEIPIRMRAGSNPGGAGHSWVKKRFVAHGAQRRFVPAMLEDNAAYLDAAEYDKSLAELDPFTRRQLRGGVWDEFEGGRFRREWFRHYKRRGGYYVFGDKLYLIQDFTTRFLTVDPAASVKETAKDDPDYTAISTWGITPCGLLVWLGCLKVRKEVPDFIPIIAQEYERWQCSKVVIESGGNQKAVIQLARRHKIDRGHFMNCVEFLPVGDKLNRAGDAQSTCEAGRLWLPSDDPGFPLEDVEAELLGFTGDERRDSHDDVVDTLSMAAKQLVRSQPVQGTTEIKTLRRSLV